MQRTLPLWEKNIVFNECQWNGQFMYMWKFDLVLISPTYYSDVIMSEMASQITSLMMVSQPFNSGTDRRKHQSSASLAFVRGIPRWPVNFPHKGPVMRKMFPFDDVIMHQRYEGHIERRDYHSILSNLEITCLFLFSWWCHDIETFYASQFFCARNPPVIGGFPSQKVM